MFSNMTSPVFLRKLPFLGVTAMVLLTSICAGEPVVVSDAPWASLSWQTTSNGRFRSGIANVRAPAGTKQIVVETKQGDGWKPFSATHVTLRSNERSRNVSVNVPPGAFLSQLRVRAYGNAKFPARFAIGKKAFERPDPSSQVGGLPIPPSVAKPNIVALGSQAVRVGDSGTPVAVESDIWKLSGHRLFFFNQYRGLQVFDLKNPASPVRTGTLRLPASGDQMYVLNDAGTAVALLGFSNSKARAGQAALFVIRIADGVPELIREIPIEGYLADSRLIGEKLYITSTVWGYSDKTAGYTSETILQAVSLLDTSNPVALPSLRFSSDGADSHLQSVGRYLLLGINSGYWGAATGSAIYLIDIATKNGVPLLVKNFQLKGRVQDKFKMSIVHGAVVATTSLWGSNGGETWVESFPVESTQTSALAQFELVAARGERLYATRYDGDHLYAVTFRNVDPLFVVDLADPSTPVLSGALEIPGWSTYIEPMGDRLLAVGVEDRRVTVSLFDVTDPASPSLLSRLSLGGKDAYSWSEANYDEKAVEFYPESALVFVPFQTWTAAGYQSSMQSIEVGHDMLKIGAAVEHMSTARRGGVIDDYIVSISGQELLVQSRTSSSPLVQMSLAWQVDRVLPFGNYLLQFEDGPSYNYGGIYVLRVAGNSGSHAMIRVTQANDPDSLVEEIELGPGRVVGVSQRGDSLYVAQWVPASESVGNRLRTWVLDISKPPLVQQVTSAEHSIAVDESSINLDETQALWATDSSLVWHIPAHRGWYGWLWCGVGEVSIGRPIAMVSQMPSAAVPLDSMQLKQNSNAIVALLCPLSLNGKQTLPNPVIQISSNKEVRDASAAFVENGFVFFSYDTAEIPVEKRPQRSARAVSPLVSAKILRSQLQVVDFRERTSVVRDAVSIPGQLLSVVQADAQGAILLTEAESTENTANRSVQASAYDGVNAFQIDFYNTGLSRWTPTVSDGVRLFLTGGGSIPSVVAIGYDPVSGRLVQTGIWKTTANGTLNVVGNFLLSSSYGILETATISRDGKLNAGVVFDTPTNLWLRIDRSVFSINGLWIPAAGYGVEFLPFMDLTVKH